MATVNGDTLNLPVIDISSADSGVAKHILDAASQYGFVFVSNENTAFDQADIQRMFGLVLPLSQPFQRNGLTALKSRNFFSLPTDVKAECSIHSSKSGKNRGWLSMHTETLDPGNQKVGVLLDKDVDASQMLSFAVIRSSQYPGGKERRE